MSHYYEGIGYNPAYDELVNSVGCDFCGSPKGDICKTVSGRETTPHSLRFSARKREVTEKSVDSLYQATTCRYCTAMKGSPCRTSSGDVRNEPHSDRRADYRRFLRQPDEQKTFKPRVVTTSTELDYLPANSVVVDRFGIPRIKQFQNSYVTGGWANGGNTPISSRMLADGKPILVIYEANLSIEVGKQEVDKKLSLEELQEKLEISTRATTDNFRRVNDRLKDMASLLEDSAKTLTKSARILINMKEEDTK